MTIIYSILIFCFLIFVHELGHFVVAKSCSVKVNEFAVGMGPAIFKKKKGETQYSLRAFPIGGYCAMEGEDEDSEDPKAFNNRPIWQRACVLAAGSFMNFIVCVILLIIIAFCVGTASTTVENVKADSPAAVAGIKAGDEIVAVDGEKIESWEDVINTLGGTKADEAVVTVKRGDEELSLKTKPEFNEETGRNMIGITSKSVKNPAAAVVQGVKNTGNMTVLMFKTLKQLFTGEVSVNELSGPVGIVYATNEAAKSGVMYVIYLAALLSLNLAIFNMLPFPALDGGRLLFLGIRKVTGKKVSDEFEGKIHFIGICLLMALMVYVTFNDVIRFII